MPHILVVEDSPTQAVLVKGLLQRNKFTVQIAGNGKQAMEAIHASLPDVVVTDLQMPEMNGLELVEAVGSEHLFLPVILMTQHGSERIAVEALEKGAASYVPKNALERELPRAIDEVLTNAAMLRRQALLRECLTETTSKFQLPNDEQLIGPLVHRLEQDLAEMGFADNLAVIRVAVALREALINAMHHGNLEVSSELRLESEEPYFQKIAERLGKSPYRERMVYVEARHLASAAVYVVRDEGPGFDPALVPDPRELGNLDKPVGRGLLLIRSFMDEVRHNASGNEITMIKRPANES